ncbi:hypothetical protein BN2476_350177 [Paraburkholderia piptadeniae]|uniref:Uncharacterized protein n=1 Tax=Paraburkholderia piptadeniae TaxID=1701573 RepID=A0A1N7S883_9BURK|nr:hypothetical protein [Paraburkholderia piptadeniae]SIT43586.1 hypothetical protein BN2476_350177 [Paraburkholderia piptadeniae]
MNVSGASGDEGLRASIVWLLTVIGDVAANDEQMSIGSMQAKAACKDGRKPAFAKWKK